ncbi:cbb3-type cytochrome c oxidase subunit I [Candidatus Protochlamydia sp. R18]|uniref:cbb3-type cytochrome c oxidase subunit I n=1 Tax=Candidatus Protochlamydia sp. R18 TaxID=1353977 RepID=UPI0006948F70|nr:cbb3-type cytochrome c oxidase subunit I [Candidatus Protochlamydia sp. R18]
MPYFVIVAILFLLQTLFEGLVAHYRVESSFYGLTIIDWIAYSLGRTWHLQLAIFWIATAWLAGGLFIAPMLGGVEPRNQKLGIQILFWGLLIMVLVSMTGEFLSTQNLLASDMWFWISNQGSKYLDLGRIWQYLLISGFFFSYGFFLEFYVQLFLTQSLKNSASFSF